MDEAETRQTLQQNLTRRFGADYAVRCVEAPGQALDLLAELDREGIAVPIVIAVLWLPGMDGLEFLARVREVRPEAQRLLMFDFYDPAVDAAVIHGMTFGVFDRVLTRQGFPAEEWLFPAVSECLAEWSRGTDRPRFEAVKIIGQQWAESSHVLRDMLNRNSIPYGFYAADSEEGRRLLADLGLSGDTLPVVASFRGDVLEAPSIEQVAAVLGARTRPKPGLYDLAVIGGGPAGLSAAVYGASEGLRTIMIEPFAVGGQAGTSSMIRNYLGFPEGISGTRLAEAAAMQARFFGVSWVLDEAVGLRADGDRRIIALEDGTEIVSRSVVIATGVTYRQLAIPALDALLGAGVYYGAATSEAHALRDQNVAIIGGGNSAGQAAVFLASEAATVTMLIRGDSLAESMSAYLVRQIESIDNIVVRTGVEVTDGGGGGRLRWLTVVETATGAEEQLPVAAAFILIGAEPRTDWLEGDVARDERGYILTGHHLVRDPERRAAMTWPLERGPHYLETCLPGVYAAGDVRHGATKRVATAVGDGALAVRFVHEFLAETDGAFA